MITPSGENTEKTFEICSKGISGIDYIKSFDTTGLPCQIAGEVDNNWIEDFESTTNQKLRKFSSRGLRLMRIAAAEASDQAKLDKLEDRRKIGVALGSHGDNLAVEDMKFILKFYDGEGDWDMKSLMKTGGYPFLNFFRRKADAATSILQQFSIAKALSFLLSLPVLQVRRPSERRQV